MQGLMVHCGGSMTTKEDLRLVPTPEKTASYTPIPFYDLVDLAEHRVRKEFGSDIGIDLQCGLNKPKTQLFAVLALRWQSGEMGPSVGLRSAHDKSIAAGVAAGARVFVCDNMMFCADLIRVMRKHTGDAWNDLELLLMGAIAKLADAFNSLDREADVLKEQHVSDVAGYEFLGRLVGENVITPTTFNEAMRQWKKPNHECFEARNAWSLYNGITEGLKGVQPQRAFGSYSKVHAAFQQRWIQGSPLDEYIEDAVIVN